MSGVSVLAVYAKNTLEEALSGNYAALQWSIMGLYALSVIATLITIKLMARIGRKVLLQFGTALCAVCLALISWSFYKKGTMSYSQS
jgi:MFS family permease